MFVCYNVQLIGLLCVWRIFYRHLRWLCEFTPALRYHAAEFLPRYGAAVRDAVRGVHILI